jgi:hypothetical protein
MSRRKYQPNAGFGDLIDGPQLSQIEQTISAAIAGHHQEKRWIIHELPSFLAASLRALPVFCV